MLIFPLKKEWYDKIKSGEKTVEYREVKSYWTKRFYSELAREFERRFNKKFCSYADFCFPVVKCDEDDKLICKIRLGYTNKYMIARIKKIMIVDGKDTDLHIDEPVYAIHFSNVREVDL